MHIFEYSGITESIPIDIAENIAKIESLRAMDRIREDVYYKELKVARESCRHSSAASSCSMEWLDTGKDSPIIEGYLNAMDGLESGYIPIDLSESGLISLHSTLMNGTTRKESRYRLRDSDPDRHDIHVNAIRAVPAQNIRNCVEQMSASYIMARDVGVQPILLAPSMVLDLLNIRPFPEESYDTICRSVANRIPQIREFATRHDLILFVCGSKSSNGKILFGECLDANPNSHLVSNESEINPQWLVGKKSIGICGATSTPMWLMNSVKSAIERIVCNEE